MIDFYDVMKISRNVFEECILKNEEKKNWIKKSDSSE